MLCIRSRSLKSRKIPPRRCQQLRPLTLHADYAHPPELALCRWLAGINEWLRKSI